MHKLRVHSRLGKPFVRCGFTFTPDPVDIEVDDEQLAIFRREASLKTPALHVVELDKPEAVQEPKPLPRRTVDPGAVDRERAAKAKAPEATKSGKAKAKPKG